MAATRVTADDTLKQSWQTDIQAKIAQWQQDHDDAAKTTLMTTNMPRKGIRVWA
jgi:hypothetical protein